MCALIHAQHVTAIHSTVDVWLGPQAIDRLVHGGVSSMHALSGRHAQPVACRGCGMLSRLTLDCPALESLDATFCYRLGNEALSWIPQCRPPLQRLYLGLCTQIDAQALHVLSSLGSLRSLDLSYTEIKVSDLRPSCNV